MIKFDCQTRRIIIYLFISSLMNILLHLQVHGRLPSGYMIHREIHYDFTCKDYDSSPYHKDYGNYDFTWVMMHDAI